MQPLRVGAQSNAPSSHLPVNRFLLIVETSRAMQRRADGSLHAVQNLVASGMRGQMHQGDSLGVWTFNESLYTGRLPTQDWSAESRRSIAGQVQKFLQSQTYEKQARLDKVIPTMLRVVKASEFITVVLVTEGTEEIHGTPYDQQINQSYKTWSSQQQDAKMPYVTVLEAQRGQFTGYTVTPAPWPVELPPLPAQLHLAKPAHSQPSGHVAKAQPAPPTVPPLIITGKKPQPAAHSNSVAQVTTPLVSAAGFEQKKTGPTVDSTAQTTTNISPSSTGSLAMDYAPPATPTKGPGSDHSESSPASLSQTPGQAREIMFEPQPSPNITHAQTPTSTTAQPEPSQTQARTAIDSTPTQASQSIQKEQAQPAKDPAPLPTEIAVAVPQRPFLNPSVVAGTVIICLLGAGMFLWSLKRRSPPAHVSLITRSFDREKS